MAQMNYRYKFDIAGFKQGDERALEYIFSTHWREFVTFAKRYASDQEAEDICSEAMNKVWVRRYDFESLAGLKAFIFLAIKNRAIDLFEKKRTESKAVKEYSYRKSGKAADNEIEEMIARVVEAGVLRRLDELTVQLPPQIRKVIQLTIDGESVSSISDKLGIARQVIYRYKDRGIELLRGGLEKKDLWGVMSLVIFLCHFF
jgi:RNA polymerase sigma factor (sigma-70 family)